MAQVLGLDAGGSKTVVVVVGLGGRVLARRDCAGLDPTAGPGWQLRLTDLAKGAGPVQAAVLGLPYHDEIPAVSAQQKALGQALFGAGCRVMNDVAVAFEGAFAGGDGVLVLAGTGSMAWARGPLGQRRVGGWGEVFGDEGSAYSIGRAALQIVSQSLDDRAPQPEFTLALLARMGVEPDGLIGWTYGRANPRAEIAALAAEVSALAQAGDAVARGLLAQAGGALLAAGQTARRLCFGAAPARWSFAGGAMRDPTLRSVLEKGMGGAPSRPELPPVGGAALLAAKAAGWAVDAEFVAQLRRSLQEDA